MFTKKTFLKEIEPYIDIALKHNDQEALELTKVCIEKFTERYKNKEVKGNKAGIVWIWQLIDHNSGMRIWEEELTATTEDEAKKEGRDLFNALINPDEAQGLFIQVSRASRKEDGSIDYNNISKTFSFR